MPMWLAVVLPVWSALKLSKAVLPEIKRFTADNAVLAALIKPQFELGKARIGKSGVVRDPALQKKAVCEICEFARSLGFEDIRTVPSKIAGGDGNTEFLMHAVIRRTDSQ